MLHASTLRARAAALEAPMLLAAARTLVAHRSLFEAVVERLHVAARRARRRLFRAYVKYMTRELARISALSRAAIKSLGVEGLGAEGCSAGTSLSLP
jgi:hypothetical protein